jgi:6-phosphofructokinase 2
LLTGSRTGGVNTIALSLGADGALLVRHDGVWRGQSPQQASGSAVGAGDSFLAGLLVKLAEAQPPAAALAFALACGTATALTPGSALCAPALIAELLPKVQVAEYIQD